MESKRNARRTSPSSATVAGGYTLITGTALLAAWWAYKRQLIRLADLRAWFACCELVAQRRASDAKSKFRPGPWHIARLTGGSESAARAAIRRLRASGILAESEAGFAIPDEIVAPLLMGNDRFHYALGQVSHHARRVPIPRRMLRMLSRSTRPVFIATVTAHLVRCLFLRSGRVASSGLCKAAWIADVFGVDERNVKAARRELVVCGWLMVDSASQRFLNRWGLPVQVNLDWTGVVFDAPPSLPLPIGRPQSPPPKAQQFPESPPPLKNTHRFQRSKNHVPDPVSGVRGPQQGISTPLRNLRGADLRSTSRLRSLFDETVQAGLLRRCAADELRFVAAAERAVSKATSNPPGFFATVVRRGLWHVISQRDEDAARRRLSPHASPPADRSQSSPSRANAVLPGLLQALCRGAGSPIEDSRPIPDVAPGRPDRLSAPPRTERSHSAARTGSGP